MLTVKSISLSGREIVQEARHVFYFPKDDGVQKADQSVPRGLLERHVKVVYPNGDADVIIGGTVFVMNDKGSTVSRWDLGASPVPLREDVDGRNSAYKAEAAAACPVVALAQ